MSKDFDIILDKCIDRLSRGESLEEVLKAYPEFAEELRPLLASVVEVSERSSFVAGNAAKIKGRERFLRERARLEDERSEREIPLIDRLFARPKVWVPVTAVVVVALVTFAVLSTFFVGIDDNEPTVAVVPPTGTPTITPPTPESTQSVPSITPDGTSASPTGIPSGTAGASLTSAPTNTPPSPQPTLIASAGILEIRVTDAPAPEISAVHMTIGNVEVQRSGAKGWETIATGTQVFDLLALRSIDGIEKTLGSMELEAGHFTQIRLDVVKVDVATIDGQTRSATVPGDKLKLVHPFDFDIEVGKTTVLTLDIDAEKSVTWENGKVRFEPKVKSVIKGGLGYPTPQSPEPPEPQQGQAESPRPQQGQPQGPMEGNQPTGTPDSDGMGTPPSRKSGN